MGSVRNEGTITVSEGSEGISFFSNNESAGNTTVNVTGDITNTGAISSTGDGIRFRTSASGTGSAGITVGGGLINTGTIQSTSDGRGIYVGAGTTITNGITNSGTIQGAGTNPYAIYVDDGASVPRIDISGDSARLAGDVQAANSALTVSGQSDGNWFASEGSFAVDSFTIGSGGAFRISNSGHTILATNGFSNQGKLKVSAGVTARITGNYTQTGAGVYVTEVDVEDGAITYGTLAVSGDVDLNALAVDVSGDAGQFLAASGENTVIGTVLTYSGTSLGASGITVEDNSEYLDFTAVDSQGNIGLTATPNQTYVEESAEKALGALTGAASESIMAETVSFGGGLERAETGVVKTAFLAT
ncbi:MAG: hypothetical protein BECKG1743D_GA0114223_101341 [Candidatus Kentron sp. G]|nr:MAG: hypothetical protein BECKG1743F_GA0114225_100892 [Candidatus Kentron sp. G]VFM97200.1 MAG: hypothetical protein BECKG1743E_GA0114224_101182 [Candidatus Kentron sp. G]VFM99609.1 MAG: hypothetical protein BECKG1743D_GA0114223_101341 [Candidatus Kentron sp. G]